MTSQTTLASMSMDDDSAYLILGKKWLQYLSAELFHVLVMKHFKYVQVVEQPSSIISIWIEMTQPSNSQL